MRPSLARLTPRPRSIARLTALVMASGALLALPVAPAVGAPATEGLVLHYPLTGSGAVADDVSSTDRDATIVGGATQGASGVVLDGVDDHVDLPDDALAGLTSITVSFDVKIDPTQQGAFFLYSFGNTSGNDGNGYLGALANRFRTTIASGNWSTEQNTQPATSRNLARGVWKTVTYTQTGTTGVLYEDGAEVGRNTAITITPASIGGGSTTANYIGNSPYAPDSTLKGTVRDFRVYDRALAAAEVAELAPTDASRVTADTAALDLGDLSAVTDDLTLPTTGEHGSSISWASSDPGVVSASGAVTRPAPTDDPAQVTLTATVSRGDAQDTREFVATVLPAEGDQAKADAAAAALTVVHADDVRGHLSLPTEGDHGSTVAWSSSAPDVVATDGLVNRPAPGAGDTTVTLTATVTVGEATSTRVIELTVRELPAPAPFAGYAFSYFTGNSVAGEKIYFAASRGNDALRWDELNGGQPVLESTYGELGLRDPFLIRSPEGDRFFLIATDLSIGRNGDWDRAQRQGSRHLEIWESTDLTTWSEQRHVEVSPPTAGNTWAPEAYWDDDLQEYVVFWASKLYAEDDPDHAGGTYNRMLYATTRDFVTFSEAQVWQDVGSSRIDSTVIKEGASYYRFTKDEGAGTTGCSDIIQEKNDSLTEPDLVGSKAWAFQDGCIGRDAGTSAVEGPTVFKRNPGDTSGGRYYLFVDEYGGRGYIPLTTDDLESPDWRVPASYDLPGSPRHGTVIPVTQAELDALRADLPGPPTPVQSTEDGLVAHLPLTGDAADVSGHGYDGTVVGGGTFADGALSLDGTDDHVDLPDDIMAGLEQITVNMDVWVDSTQATPYFVYGLGNSAGGAGNGYLFTTGNAYRSSITHGNWTGEQTATSGADLERGAWKTLTYTLDGSGTARIYLDGVEVGTKTGITFSPGDIGEGRTTANYIGRSLYTGDKHLKGKVRDFSLWSRALSASEVAELAAPPTAVLDVELGSLAAPPVIRSAGATITLPVEPGTDLTALDPSYVVPAGATVTPDGLADYSSPREVTVTNGDESRVWTVRAVELRSPVLPGLYADPNIAEFDGTYYIYATTDGVPGWGGKEFYVWSSTDLVEWTRSAEPILTLDGANGDVPWATGNAWAPTIIERDGKFYFYFSGHHAQLNRKTIGVAVADSPTGPFTAEPQAMILNNEAVTSGQAIDPAAFRDPVSGKHYLYWGNGSPVMAELADDMVSLEPGTISAMSGLTGYREGSFMNFRDGVYHLTYSIDDTGSPNYRVGYATSTSPTGPWTYRGVILEKDQSQGILGTGHSSIVQVPGTDEWLIAYHRFAYPTLESPIGDGTHRETTIDRLTFGDDGLIEQVVPTLDSVDPLVYTDGPVTGSVSDAGGGGWHGADAELTLSGDAPVLQWRAGDGPWTAYSTPVALPSGSYDVAWRARSANGAWSQVWSMPVKVDDTPPAVSGSVSVDRVLTVAATDDASGVAVRHYRLDGGGWLTWTTPVQLDGAAHTVDLRATDVAGNSSAVRSLSVEASPTPGPVAPVSTAPPVIGGRAVVGRTLTASPGGWDQEGLAHAYQWLRDGVPIPGATDSRLLLGAADVGRRMSVQVTASRPGGPSGVAASAETRPVAKARARVRVRVADRTPAAGVRTKVSVRVSTIPSTVRATGRVVVRVDGKVVRRLRLRDGRASLRLAFPAGKHAVKVTYAGSRSVARDSARATVRALR